MNLFLSEHRAQTRRHLTEKTLDVLVLGGGITGGGVARDAAMRGLCTGLVDRHDFAFGTSSRSSRLLHGGLRYLEQGRVGLVREASAEKKTIREIAPHLADPMGFVFPIYQIGGRPLWQVRVGVKLYDVLCSGRNFKPSRGFTRDETLRSLPGLNREGLLGSVRYFDALTNDARLVLDTLRSAVAQGATVANYVRFRDAKRIADIWTCELEDALKGETFSVRTRTLVNATGPWAQQIPHSAVKLRLSKGIHVVVDRRSLPWRAKLHGGWPNATAGRLPNAPMNLRRARRPVAPCDRLTGQLERVDKIRIQGRNRFIIYHVFTLHFCPLPRGLRCRPRRLRSAFLQ